MTSTSLPSRRNRWRSAAAGVAIAVVSFTGAACGTGAEDEGGDGGGVVEQEDGEQEGEEEEDD